VSDVVLFPGAKLSPEVLLHQCLEGVEEYKAALVIHMDKGDVVDIAMSCMSLADLTFMAAKLQIYVVSMLKGEPPDESARLFVPDDSA